MSDQTLDHCKLYDSSLVSFCMVVLEPALMMVWETSDVP